MCISFLCLGEGKNPKDKVRSNSIRSWYFRVSPLSTQQWKPSPLFGQDLWDESIFYEVATQKNCGFWCFVDFFHVLGQIFVDSPIVESVRISSNILCHSVLKDCLFLFLAESTIHCFVCKNVLFVINVIKFLKFWMLFLMETIWNAKLIRYKIDQAALLHKFGLLLEDIAKLQ